MVQCKQKLMQHWPNSKQNIKNKKGARFKMMDSMNNLITIVNDARLEAVKFFEKGNAQAGTRLRKAMQQVRELGKTIRDEVAEKKAAAKAAKSVNDSQ